MFFRGASAEDFRGVRAIIGERHFEKMAIAYLYDCPSQSFKLRNLGSRLEGWLREHPEHTGDKEEIALAMVRLEWAEIECFDEAAKPKLTEADLPTLGADPKFELQPHIQLLECAYPVDDLLIKVRSELPETDIVSNAVTERPHSHTRRRRLPNPERIYLAVHRVDNTVYFKRLGSRRVPDRVCTSPRQDAFRSGGER